ncbi:MAG TPA: hypothetical protein VFT90_17010 [Chryseosolibacter sp.]|nr:hypothetical protein [Chryseosolibacter sp.]
MAKKSNPFNEPLYLADGGLETTLIFHQSLKLNHFATLELLNHDEGKQALRKYYQPYLQLAAQYGTRFILETPTWRANPDWALKLGEGQFRLATALETKSRFIIDTGKAENPIQ